MFYSTCMNHCHRGTNRCRRAALVFAGVLILLIFVEQAADGGDVPHDDQSIGQVDAGDHRSATRTNRRSRRTSATAAVAAEQEPTAPKRRRRSTTRSRHRRNPNPDSKVRLELSGNFDLALGSDIKFQGEGSITLELDQAAAERLGVRMIEQVDRAAPLAKELNEFATGLFEALNSTSHILTSLSSPETQQNLRQVEQLLRLLEQTSSFTATGE